MKKIGLLLLSTLMAVCVFTSCSDDDDDKIVGVWKIEGTEIAELKLAEEDNKQEIIDLFKEEYASGPEEGTIEFKKDGNYYSSGDYDDSGKYWFSNDKLYLQSTGKEESDQFDYQFDGKKTFYVYITNNQDIAMIVEYEGQKIFAQKLVTKVKYVKQ